MKFKWIKQATNDHSTAYRVEYKGISISVRKQRRGRWFAYQVKKKASLRLVQVNYAVTRQAAAESLLVAVGKLKCKS